MSSPPHGQRLAELAGLSPAYFGMVMATGIVSLAADLLLMPGIAQALFRLNIVVYAVLWILNTGAQWHMLPQCYPNYKTVHRRFQQWCEREILREILTQLANALREQGEIGREIFVLQSGRVQISKRVRDLEQVLAEIAGAEELLHEEFLGTLAEVFELCRRERVGGHVLDGLVDRHRLALDLDLGAGVERLLPRVKGLLQCSFYPG